MAIVGSPALAEAAPPESAEENRDSAVVSGVVKDSRSDTPIENAVVILMCTCLSEEQQLLTNARGIYSFQDLPPGNYTIQALAGKANVSKIVQLPRAAKFRANFGVDPNDEQAIVIVVDASPIPTNPAATMLVDMDQARQLPVGADRSRESTRVGDLPPRAAFGFRLQRSLLDDAGAHQLLGGPRVTVGLL